MRIKICGLFRDEDIDFINEARPDYIGFVFTKSPRQISTALAQFVRFRIADGIVPVGVFVNAPIAMITELYQNGVISIAQLHGNEDESYITGLKRASVTSIRHHNRTPEIKVIKAIRTLNSSKILTTNQHELEPSVHTRTKKKSLRETPSNFSCSPPWLNNIPSNADYILLDSGAGSGKTFDWDQLKSIKFSKPWFLAGGINIKNIKQAFELNPFAVDVSSGAETDGIKDRKKILDLVAAARGK